MDGMAPETTFKPALVIVDFQEDFCPPSGSLAVPDGRSIASTINSLLSLPFALKIATRDWHPINHISFAANHASATAYTSSHTITHPSDPLKSYTTSLWPTHCVQDTPGAQLVPELDAAQLDGVVDKGQDASVEMYSAFHDPLRVCDSGLAERLRAQGVTHVFVVGLAADFCVRATAESALEEGFEALIVEEATRAVVPDGWAACRRRLEEKGVRIVSMEGEEVARVRVRGGEESL